MKTKEGSPKTIEEFPVGWQQEIEKQSQKLKPTEYLNVQSRTLRIRHPQLPEGLELLTPYDFQCQVYQSDH